MKKILKTFVASTAILGVISVNESTASGDKYSLKEDIEDYGIVGSNGNINYGFLLLNAVTGRQLDQVKKLLSEGADVNVTNENGYSALQLAVLNNDIETVRLLVKSGKLDINL